jgi:hypothetical protein
VFVDEISNDTTSRAEEDVEKTEHRSPVTASCLSEVGEVLEVVGSEDGVDGEFTSERAEVAHRSDEGLWGADDLESLLEGRLDNDFALSLLEHLLARHLRLVVVVGMLGTGNVVLGLDLLVIGGGSALAVALPVGDVAWNVDNLCSDAVCLKVLLHVHVTFRPFAGRSVGAEKKHAHGSRDDQDEWHNKRHTPCDMRGKSAAVDQGVENRGHDEVGDTTTSVTPAACQSVCSSDNVLVKETSRPDLAGDEGTTENADEESKYEQATDVRDGSRQSSRQGTGQEAKCKGVSRADGIT